MYAVSEQNTASGDVEKDDEDNDSESQTAETAAADAGPVTDVNSRTLIAANAQKGRCMVVCDCLGTVSIA